MSCPTDMNAHVLIDGHALGQSSSQVLRDEEQEHGVEGAQVLGLCMPRQGLGGQLHRTAAQQQALVVVLEGW